MNQLDQAAVNTGHPGLIILVVVILAILLAVWLYHTSKKFKALVQSGVKAGDQYIRDIPNPSWWPQVKPKIDAARTQFHATEAEIEAWVQGQPNPSWWPKWIALRDRMNAIDVDSYLNKP